MEEVNGKISAAVCTKPEVTHGILESMPVEKIEDLGLAGQKRPVQHADQVLAKLFRQRLADIGPLGPVLPCR